MKAVQTQWRDGLKEASRVTGISLRQASLTSGFNQNQVSRFTTGETDIKLGTLIEICEVGFKLPFITVFNLGAAT